MSFGSTMRFMRTGQSDGCNPLGAFAGAGAGDGQCFDLDTGEPVPCGGAPAGSCMNHSGCIPIPVDCQTEEPIRMPMECPEGWVELHSQDCGGEVSGCIPGDRQCRMIWTYEGETCPPGTEHTGWHCAEDGEDLARVCCPPSPSRGGEMDWKAWAEAQRRMPEAIVEPGPYRHRGPWTPPLLPGVIAGGVPHPNWTGRPGVDPVMYAPRGLAGDPGRRQLEIGDAVRITRPHGAGDMRGWISAVYSGPAYEVRINGKPHRWYIADEMKAI